MTYAQCYICKRGPYKLQNLYAHMRKVHKCSEEHVKTAQNAIKKALYEQEVKCDICEKSYFSTGGLRKHKRVAHGGDTIISTVSTEHNEGASRCVDCPGCSSAFYTNMELAVHCEQEHSNGCTDFRIIEENFDSWTKFEAWMTEKERETCSKLVKRHTRKSRKGTIYMYLCQHARRSGDSTSNPSKERKRNRKTKRVNKHCPCFARVQHRRDGSVEVVSCFGHYGHDVNSAALPLSKDDKMAVKSMLMAGISPRAIVTKLRRSNWIEEEIPQKQPRICYLTVRDVTNIAARHGLTVVKNDDSGSNPESSSSEASSSEISLQEDFVDQQDDHSLDEAYQESLEIQENIEEVARHLLQTGRADLLKQLNSHLQVVLEDIKREFTTSNPSIRMPPKLEYT
ncbi:hypothetical protein Aduo_002122 [Ancylostoma duodenale]